MYLKEFTNVPVVGVCEEYGKAWGTTSHGLLFCERVKHFWKQTKFWKPMKRRRFSSMREIGGEIFKKFGKVDFEIWVVTLSSIWVFLCKEKHEPHGPKVEVGFDFSQSLLEAFHAARGSLLLSMTIGVKIGIKEWIPPTHGVFRLDVDAAFQEERGRFGVGAVVRDWKGMIRAALVKPIQRPTLMLDAELNAVLYGVGLCLQENFVPFVVYSDSLLTIRLLENGEEGRAYIERELPPLAEVVQNGFIIGFLHMLREANFVAQTLACFGAGCEQLCPWNTNYPHWLRELVA